MRIALAILLVGFSLVARASGVDLYRVSSLKLVGVRDVKEVIAGGLYRGGGPGGTVPLSTAALNSLCQAGFSAALYMYDTGFTGKRTVSCTYKGQPHQLTYDVGGFRDPAGRRKSLEVIRKAIVSGAGPVFEHCWNGWHASGELAAIALMQFCDWNGDEAGDYWVRNIGDQGNLSNYTSIYQRHIPSFTPFGDLKLPAASQSGCPRP